MVLTFLGGGALASFLAYLINRRKEDRKDFQTENITQQTINNNLFKEIGRLTEKLEKIEKEKKETDEENLELKEKNFKLEAQLEELRKDYTELRESYVELKKDYEEIKLLLIKKEK